MSKVILRILRYKSKENNMRAPANSSNWEIGWAKFLRRRFVLVFSVTLLFASIFPVSIFVSTVEAQGEGWLGGWNHRKSHTINPATGAGTNYPVRVVVNYGNGTDSGENVYLNSSSYELLYHKITVDAAVHSDYGLSYPVTYVFSIPENSSNLKAYKRYAEEQSWSQLETKTSDDFFNSIECVRFDYTANRAYVNVAFSSVSDEVHIKITDQNGNIVSTSFLEVAKYYDNRKAVVVATADDLCGESNLHSAFMSACDAFQNAHIWLTVGIITVNNYEVGGGPPNWTAIQGQLDEGYIEAASHSRTHIEVPYNDYDSEIGGSKNDIISNLTMPSLYRKGESEYMWAWIEPYGISDSTVRQKLGQYKYLIARTTLTGQNSFATWDNVNNLFEQYGISICADGQTASTLNEQFDARYVAGEIYYLYFHPINFDWSGSNAITEHLDYIKSKTDVWYVGLGALYAYRYAHLLAEVNKLKVTGVYNITKAKPDFGDIRFTKEDGITLLDYWMEEKVDGYYAVFWVRVADDLSTNPATIYIYYGKSDAATTSNAYATFIRVIDGLVLALPMDEGEGTTVNDRSGNNKNGTIHGATWVDGKYGKALSFDGVDDYVDFGDILGFEGRAPFSVVFWIYDWGYTGIWDRIVSKEKVAAPRQGWIICRISTQNQYYFTRFRDGNEYGIYFTYTPENWNYIAFTYDGSNMQGYLNGDLKSTTANTLEMVQTGTSLKLGRASDGTDFFRGIVGEVRIFNRALEQAEISDLHNYYPFESLNFAGKTLIRKLVIPEPSHGAWGSEETAGQEVVYYPSGYNLMGSTAYVSGSLSNLQSDDSVYMQFRSYVSASSTTSKTNAFIAYRDSTTSLNSPKERTWTGDAASWDSQNELPTASSPVRFVKVAYCPLEQRSFEKIVVTLSDDGYLDAYVWNGDSWEITNNIARVWTTAPSGAQRPYDIAYETLSGRALLVYDVVMADATKDLGYRIWTYGSGWSQEYYIDFTGVASTNPTISFIELASNPDPTSNQIAMAFLDQTNRDSFAAIWTGSAWTLMTTLTTNTGSTSNTRESIGVAYSTYYKKVLAVSGNGANRLAWKWYVQGETNWRTGTAFDPDPDYGDDLCFIQLKPDPAGNSTHDYIMYVGVNDLTDLNAWAWNMAEQTPRRYNIVNEVDDSIDTYSQRCLDFAWEPTGNKGLIVWGTTSGYINYNTYSISAGWGASWTKRVTMAGGIHPWIQLRTNPIAINGDVKILGAVLTATVFDIGTTKWDGTTLTVIGTNTISSNTGVITYECFELEFMKYGPPTEFTCEVEFTGTSNTESWSQLVWTIDSAFTTDSVTVTFQLYNYHLGQYPTSGDGYMTDTIGTTDITKTQTITTNPTYFRDTNGNWKIKIKCTKATSIQFTWKVDLVKYEVS
jgi:hypothetical protein